MCVCLCVRVDGCVYVLEWMDTCVCVCVCVTVNRYVYLSVCVRVNGYAHVCVNG